MLSPKENDKNKDERNKKILPPGVFLPPELILFIKEFEKLMEQIITNPDMMSYSLQPRLLSFKITLDHEGKPKVTPINPKNRDVDEENQAGLEDNTEFVIEGNEVTVVTRLSPHIKKAKVQASGKEMQVLVGKDKIMTIKLPVRVKKKESEVRLRNGVLNIKLRKKSFL